MGGCRNGFLAKIWKFYIFFIASFGTLFVWIWLVVFNMCLMFLKGTASLMFFPLLRLPHFSNFNLVAFSMTWFSIMNQRIFLIQMWGYEWFLCIFASRKLQKGVVAIKGKCLIFLPEGWRNFLLPYSITKFKIPERTLTFFLETIKQFFL